jgi:hypothetical protein
MAPFSLFPSRSASMAHSRSDFCSAIASSSSQIRPSCSSHDSTPSRIGARKPRVYRELAAHGSAGELRGKIRGANESLLDGARADVRPCFEPGERH